MIKEIQTPRHSKRSSDKQRRKGVEPLPDWGYHSITSLDTSMSPDKMEDSRLIFRDRSHYASLAILELEILLPQPPE